MNEWLNSAQFRKINNRQIDEHLKEWMVGGICEWIDEWMNFKIGENDE